MSTQNDDKPEPKPMVLWGQPLCFNCGCYHHGQRAKDCPDVPGKVRDDWSND